MSGVYGESIEDPLLSRRSFLAALAAGAAALALDPYRYVTARAGVYANARLGFSLLLPERHQRAHTFHLADDAVSPACDGTVWRSFLESVRYEA